MLRAKRNFPEANCWIGFQPFFPTQKKEKKKKKSQEKDRQTEEERHLTHISLQDNHTKTIQLSHHPWGPKLIYRVVAPEMQIIPGLHSLIWLDFPTKKTLFSPCLSDPWVSVKNLSKRSRREGPGPDSPAWDYSENVVFEWKARLSELTLANLPLHIQPLLALASRVKRSGSATQTPTGLCYATLLFSFRHFWEPEKLSSTPGNDEATRRPTLTTWADWQRL